MSRTVRLLVGTRKGGFIYTADARRECWDISEPMLPGWSFYNLVADDRHDPPLLYAAANHFAWGRAVAKSTDFGATWDYRSEGLSFPPDMGLSVGNAWCVRPGHPSQPGVVYCGTQPAGLFRSEDWGHTWAPVESFNRHPTRTYWTGTGGGDSCVHSIEIDPRDPNRMYVCVSAGGSYVTHDGGATWEIFSHNPIAQTPEARAFLAEIQEQFPMEAPPGVDPAAADEMHSLRLDRKHPDRLWTQTHIGVFRSDDAGTTWADVTPGLPSFHGFPVAVTKRSPDAAFVVPLEFQSNNFRVCPGQFTVYRTRDSGASWEPLTRGLRGPHDYQSV
jgi:photosystem II stability/assembly factor-like uncharacterized protein